MENSNFTSAMDMQNNGTGFVSNVKSSFTFIGNIFRLARKIMMF